MNKQAAVGQRVMIVQRQVEGTVIESFNKARGLVVHGDDGQKYLLEAAQTRNIGKTVPIPEEKEQFKGYAPMLVAGVGDRTKDTGGFGEVLSKIAEDNPHTPLAARYGSRDAQAVKVREAVERAREKTGGAME